jgi:hypothetical protein
VAEVGIAAKLRVENAREQFHDRGEPDPGSKLLVREPSSGHGHIVADYLTL